jgi:hypothetical protein
MMAKRTNRVAWGLVVVLAVVGLLLTGCRSRRSVPIQNGDTVVWKGGSVSVWDYSYDFGGYDNQIEWASPSGKREVLARVGDSPVDLEVLLDGRLEAKHYNSYDGRTSMVIILTWRDRHSPPIKVEVKR